MAVSSTSQLAQLLFCGSTRNNGNAREDSASAVRRCIKTKGSAAKMTFAALSHLVGRLLSERLYHTMFLQ